MEDNKQSEEGFSIEKSQTAIKIIGIANNMFGQEVPPVPDKMPSALQYIKRIAPLSETFTLKGVENMMESFASLARENERQNWELKNDILLAQVKTLETIIEFQKLQINNGK